MFFIFNNHNYSYGKPRNLFTFELKKVTLLFSSNSDPVKASQNCRTTEVARDLWIYSGPIPLLKQGCL